MTSSIFGSINKLIMYDNKYYIHDHQTKKIFVFQADGTFVRTIGSIGKGPGEYTHLEDFVIDEENKRIFILGFPSIIYEYDLEGNYIGQKQFLQTPVWRICSYRDGFSCSNNHENFAQGDEPLIYLFDKKFNLNGKMGKKFPGGRTLPLFVSQPFLKDGENIAYFDNSYSTLNFINTTNPDKSEKINFILQNPIPFDVLLDLQKFMTHQSDYSFFQDVYLYDDIFQAFFVNQGKMCVLVKDLKSKKQITAKYNSWPPHIMNYNNGYFYAAASVHWILDEDSPVTSAKRVTKYPIDENSNPVILKFKPKQILK